MMLGVAFRPTVPSQTSGLAVMRSLELNDLRLNRETERRKFKTRIRLELGRVAVVKINIGNVIVIARPNRRVNQFVENVRRRNALDDNLIRGKVVGRAGQIDQLISFSILSPPSKFFSAEAFYQAVKIFSITHLTVTVTWSKGR